MNKKKLAIIGNGMATCRLLDGLLAKGGLERFSVTVYGDEPYGAYNRIQLGKLFGGGSPEAILTKPRAWYEQHGVVLRAGVRVERLDTRARLVETPEGSEPYDVAVIATGSTPIFPRIEGAHGEDGSSKAGVFVYRTLDDAQALDAAAEPGKAAVVLGGGLLGLEAAKALCDRGLHVTVVHLAHGLMNTQLDYPAGEMLRRHMERAGMFVRTGQTVESVVGEERVEGVVLDSGEELAADLLVVACGVRPRVEVGKASGLLVNRGIVVNDALSTQAPGVYAIGECSEHQGATYGLVAPAWEQADVLASILSGADPRARYLGSKVYARLKVAGVEVASLGVLDGLLESDRVIQVIEEREASYRKLIVRGGELIGAMMVGDTSAAASLIQTFDRGQRLPEDPLLALCPGAVSSVVSIGPRTVCNCNRVTDDTIRMAIAAGAEDVAALGQATRAGTGCGTCKVELERLLREPRRVLALA